MRIVDWLDNGECEEKRDEEELDGELEEGKVLQPLSAQSHTFVCRTYHVGIQASRSQHLLICDLP